MIDSIVSQQISGKAAETVFNRLCNLVGEISPAAIARVSVEEIQQCGMSLRKASYIKGIADAVFSGEFNLEELKSLPDDQVIKRLTTLRGVGAWTAEMLMIFSMERPDVVSWDDLGIRRGMCKLYNHKVLTKEQFMRYKKRYSPFGSVASLYLWEISAE